jgi:hypothetical protein
VATRGGRSTALAIAVLGALVLALLASWGYARLRPRDRMRVSGPERRVVRVQVLNGSGESGIGARVASSLREGGFHVVEVANADRPDYFATMVVARTPDAAAAEAVARYLGGLPVLRQAWTSDHAEVTVVIGGDRSRLRGDL